MPELPEVETARRRIEAALGGRRIVAVRVVADPIVFDGFTPARVRARLRGRVVVGTGRRGKYTWLALDRRPWLVIHLGMSGTVASYAAPADPPPGLRLELTAEGGGSVAVTSRRRLGRILFRDDPPAEDPVRRLGRDPLLEPFSGADLAGLLAGRAAPIKTLLLDQHLFAGVGNWIADEVLYRSGIAPGRPAGTLDRTELLRMARALDEIIRRAVAVGAEARRFPRGWLFHRRWGRKEGARTPRGSIRFDTIGGRTTAWVPEVQW